MWRFYVPAAGHKVQSKVWLTCITIPERGSILLSLSRIFEYVAKTANRGSSFAWSGRCFANSAYISGRAGFSARWLWLTFCPLEGIQDRGNEWEEISYEVLLLHIVVRQCNRRERILRLPTSTYNRRNAERFQARMSQCSCPQRRSTAIYLDLHQVPTIFHTVRAMSHALPFQRTLMFARRFSITYKVDHCSCLLKTWSRRRSRSYVSPHSRLSSIGISISAIVTFPA